MSFIGKFVAECIIAKLPPSWRNFSTTLKHKRQEILVGNLIASLDVEEKAQAKDTYGRASLAAMWCKITQESRTKGK